MLTLERPTAQNADRLSRRDLELLLEKLNRIPTSPVEEPLTEDEILARKDIWAVLDKSPNEVPAVRAALVEGKIDGQKYTGKCCCLLGWLAKANGSSLDPMLTVLTLGPDGSRPAEKFFRSIHPGDLPSTNRHSALAVAWVDEWTARGEAGR